MEMDHLDRYLCFVMGADEHGLPLAAVSGVLHSDEIQWIQKTTNTHFVQFRGHEISLVNTKITNLISHENSSLIVLEFKKKKYGLLVDHLSSVRSLSPREVLDAKSSGFILDLENISSTKEDAA